MQLVALLEILDMFEHLTEENRDKVCYAMINTDICTFFNQTILYNDRIFFKLVNKIILILSETDKFFEHQFFPIIKSYLRVIGSLPRNGNLDNQYTRDIFNVATLLMKRARARFIDLYDDRMPLKTLLCVSSIISENHLIHTAALDFVNLSVEIINESNGDLKLYERFMYNIIKNLNMNKEYLESVEFLLFSSKILHNILTFTSIHDLELKDTMKVIVEKFMILMEFILVTNHKIDNYEIFTNMFYYLLNSQKLDNAYKMVIINYCFRLNGHNFFVNLCENASNESSPIIFKTKIVMAEILTNFLRFINTIPEEENLQLKRNCYKTVFESNFSLIRYKKNIHQMELTDMVDLNLQMIIYLQFIDHSFFRLQNRVEVFTNLATMISVMDIKKITLDKNFYNMLVVLFTEYYIKIDVPKNNIIMDSSTILLNSIHNKKFLNIKFLKWWRGMKPNIMVFNDITMNYLYEASDDDVNQLSEDDFIIFKKTILLKNFLDPKISTKYHRNVSKVLCHFPLSPVEYNKCLKKVRQLSKIDADDWRIVDCLSVLSASSQEPPLLLEAAKDAMLLMKSTQSDQLKLITMEFACQLIIKTIQQPSSS
ncbi:unnamed protein product [Diamesa serratosioi]